MVKLVSRSWSKELSKVITTVTGNCSDCQNTATPLDRETFDSVELCLTVTDNNTVANVNQDERKCSHVLLLFLIIYPYNFCTVYIVVIISDVNDNNPVFNDLNQSPIVEGNATVIGTVFGSVRASDIDTNNIITYSIRYYLGIFKTYEVKVDNVDVYCAQWV